MNIPPTLKQYNLQRTGKGEQPLLFIHGYGCDQNMWRKLLPYFEQDYQIFLMDLIGAGQSDLSAYDYQKYNSLQGYADDILEIVNQLDLQQVIVVGHSVSAMIGLLAVNGAPERFAGLVMVAPSPCYMNKKDYTGGFSEEDIQGLMEAVESNYLGWSSEITPAIMGNPERPELAEELKESFCRNNPDIARHFAKVTFTSDNRADLNKCSIPVSVLQVANDFLASTKVGEYIHEELPDGHYHLLEASGHCPHMSHPELTAQAILSFLSAISPPQRPYLKN